MLLFINQLKIELLINLKNKKYADRTIVFQISGNFPSFNNCSNFIFKGTVIDILQILTFLIDKLSHPCALVGSNDFFIGNISFSVTQKEFTLVFVLY